MTALQSQLCVGRVMHWRLRPVENRFDYPVFFVRLRLAELERLTSTVFGVNRWRLLGIRYADYGARDGSHPAVWIRQVLTDAGLDAVCDGDVWLQTFPRVLGMVFNPVSFWLCQDSRGALRALLAEVNNTFGEHHAYLLARDDGGVIDPASVLSCHKAFHVSPFCPVAGDYRFRVLGTQGVCRVAIDYQDETGPLLKTAVWGRPQAWTSVNLIVALLRQPLLCLGVIARIHWQAWRLWRKRAPFYRKPAPPPAILSR